MAVNHPSINIKIVEINVNSLISLERRHNLIDFTNTHKPDIILVVETVLQTNHRIQFPNYNFIRTDKDTSPNSRGTGLLIRENIKFEVINTLHWKLQSLDTTATLIETENKENYSSFLPIDDIKQVECLT